MSAAENLSSSPDLDYNPEALQNFLAALNGVSENQIAAMQSRPGVAAAVSTRRAIGGRLSATDKGLSLSGLEQQKELLPSEKPGPEVVNWRREPLYR